jgi:hypothetical protein
MRETMLAGICDLKLANRLWLDNSLIATNRNAFQGMKRYAVTRVSYRETAVPLGRGFKKYG